MSQISTVVSEDIRCCVCGNNSPERFFIKYRFPNFEVVQCSDCSFLFIPPYYRRKIVYTQYKDASVTEAVRSGNNWVKIQRHKLRFKFISKFIRKGKLFDLG